MRPARLVELPVGATEDRVVGSLDIERALAEGVKAYEPGLLAAAHRGVLYVDEVNLLHDHLVDLLLDAAALGVSYVEREGVSVRHAARFLLVGTMNPEEGELRPQLLDRFGLTVEAAAPRDPGPRTEVVRRRLAFDADPAAFADRWRGAETELAERIVAAQRAAAVGRRCRMRRCGRWPRCARGSRSTGCGPTSSSPGPPLAHAAWEGRSEVDRRRRPRRGPPRAAAPAAPQPVRRPRPGRGASSIRRSRTPPQQPEPDLDPTRDDPQRTARADPDPPDAPGAAVINAPPSGRSADRRAADHRQPPTARRPAPPARRSGPRQIEIQGLGAGAAGRRSRAETDSGRVTRARRHAAPGRIHLPATLAAAAPHQRARGRAPGGGLVLRRDDLREARHEGREGNLVLFVVDASGSMAARARMGAVKGAVLSLLLDAYQRRDKVGLITFRGADAELLLPPTSSVEAAAARLTALPTGGRTPLAAGLLQARQALRVERLRDPRAGRCWSSSPTGGRHRRAPTRGDAARRRAARRGRHRQRGRGLRERAGAARAWPPTSAWRCGGYAAAARRPGGQRPRRHGASGAVLEREAA